MCTGRSETAFTAAYTSLDTKEIPLVHNNRRHTDQAAAEDQGGLFLCLREAAEGREDLFLYLQAVEAAEAQGVLFLEAHPAVAAVRAATNELNKQSRHDDLTMQRHLSTHRCRRSSSPWRPTRRWRLCEQPQTSSTSSQDMTI